MFDLPQDTKLGVKIDLEPQVASITTPKYSKISAKPTVWQGLPASGSGPMPFHGRNLGPVPTFQQPPPSPAAIIGMHHLGRAVSLEDRPALVGPLKQAAAEVLDIGVAGRRVHHDGSVLGNAGQARQTGPIGIYPPGALEMAHLVFSLSTRVQQDRLGPGR